MCACVHDATEAGLCTAWDLESQSEHRTQIDGSVFQIQCSLRLKYACNQVDQFADLQEEAKETRLCKA